MQFVKFSSLENTYRQNLIDKVQYEGKDGGEWIATSKLHGANFSFWCDGKEVKVASRTQFVDGTFYNCQAVINRYSESILEYCRDNSVVDLVIYGELYGNGIQKEVAYGEKDFAAFDVVVDGKVLNKRSAFQVAACCNVLWTPIIHVGTFEECLALNNTFQSKLTPVGFEGDNFEEGLVIEPMEPAWFNNGSRIYFKNKTEKFSEKKVRKEKQVFELSDVESELMSDLLLYNTVQRVSNVLGKMGAITSKDFGKILGLTVKDILEDFEKDTEVNPKVVAQDNWSHFNKILSANVSEVVRKEFLQRIE